MAKRILHILGGMNRAGVETWLMHVLRHIDRQRFHMDFAVHMSGPCAYDDEIRSLGSRVIACAHPHRPWAFARDLKHALHAYGPYDVVHSHCHHFSGYVLRVARHAGVPVRIAHCHSDTSAVQAKAPLLRRIYLALTERWVSAYATTGLAASRQAAACLFGPAWEGDPRCRTLYYGIDLTPFRTETDLDAIRAELGIPKHALVIGHVGRFAPVKNHALLLEIAAHLAERMPDLRLLLVGDGPLRAAIEGQAAQAGLAGRVLFAGVRSDVPRLMQGAMDVFLFPSRFEGLGMVLVEAQAAGLPCVISDVVPKEADVVDPLIRRLSLSQPDSAWAAAVLAARDTAGAVSQRHALEAVEQSRFNLHRSIEALEGIYSV